MAFLARDAGISPMSIVERDEGSSRNPDPQSGRSLAVNRYNWVEVRASADFSKRYAHAVVLNHLQHMFLIGGATADFDASEGSGYLNDVWVSRDLAQTWEFVVPRSERFGPRRGHAAVLDINRVVMFVLGGFCGKDCFKNDWWSSTEGVVWHKMGDASWSPRHGHAVVMTSDRNLILFGGHDGRSYLGDIWSIRDPAQALVYSSWECMMERAPWEPRYGHAVVVNELDAIFLIGGFSANKHSGQVQCFNDVWKSPDGGSSWEMITEDAPWAGRYQHVAQINTDEQLFIVGGLAVNLERLNDMWRSSDSGETWINMSPVTPWAPRYEHAAVIDRNNTVFILGGVSTGSEKFNDIWRSERTCADDVECMDSEMVCRDGTHENFMGLPNPICVGLCDRRIFDECESKEACRVRNKEATCIDPCKDLKCDGGQVCEIEARGNEFHGEVLTEAAPYCLTCLDSETKFACVKFADCDWSPEDEECRTKCSALETEDSCTNLEYCQWADNSCSSSGGEE